MATRKRNQKQQNNLPWGAMIISFAVGVFVMFLLHLKDNVPVDNKPENTKKTEEKKSTAIEPTFDFYTLLPEMEVVANAPKETKKKQIATAPQQQSSVSKQTGSDSYLIQVGSFKNAADADSFRARLALLGVESKVQTVTIDNTDTWHRVQVGPIVGRALADKLQQQLKQNGIDSLLMRAKHG